MKKIRVLYFVDRMLTGGIQKFVVENIKRFDLDKIKVDVLLLDDGNEYLEEEKKLKEIGCDVFKLEGVWIKNIFDFIKYYKAMDLFFKKHNNYDVVHLHSSSKNFMFLMIAKKYGIPMRIAHAHSTTFQTTNYLKMKVGNILKCILLKYANYYCACSEDAAEWLFGKNNVNNTMIIHNAVDIKRFSFNLEKRNEIRELYGIEDHTIILGHVGRFSLPKNHLFLLEIFKEAKMLNDDLKLMLIGVGELQQKIEEKAKKLEIEKDIIFVGFKNNVENYMNAMDYFVFPSLYEGLGLVLIEAQANGLKTFTSDKVVPKEAKLTELLEYISLEKSARFWAKSILSTSKERKALGIEIKNKGYDIVDTAKQLENLYIKGLK